MPDDFEKQSAEVGKHIEEAKRRQATPTDKEQHDAAAAQHAVENGTGLNSGKA